MTEYSNPRLRAVIDNWPIGSKRCTATFMIERNGKGERGVRTTVGAPKKLTYARKARIVDGDDGRTYIAELSAYGFVSIMRGDMKFQHEAVFDTDPRFRAIMSLFSEGRQMTCFPVREPSLAALTDAPVSFRYGSNKRRILVDALTARAILAVVAAISDENREKLERMIKSPSGLAKVADFAMSKCSIA